MPARAMLAGRCNLVKPQFGADFNLTQYAGPSGACVLNCQGDWF